MAVGTDSVRARAETQNLVEFRRWRLLLDPSRSTPYRWAARRPSPCEKTLSTP